MGIQQLFSCQQPHLTSTEFSIFLSGLILLLVVGNIAGKLSLYFKQPLIVGQLLVGCIIGKSGLGRLFPDALTTLFPDSGSVAIANYSITQISVVIVMFLIGLDVSTRINKKILYNVCVLNTTMIFIPFIAGLVLAIFFPGFFATADLPEKSKIVFSLFMGILFFIPPLTVIYHALIEIPSANAGFKDFLLTSMGISEIFAWTLFAILAAAMDDTHIVDSTVLLIGLSIAYLLLLMTVGQAPLRKILLLSEKHQLNSTAVYLILCLISCVIVTICGLHIILGAFAMGIAINNSHTVHTVYRREIESIVSNIFFPIFFLYVGIKTDFIGNFNLPLFLVVYLSCTLFRYFAAFITGSLLKDINNKEKKLIQWMAVTRGATEVLIGKLALKHGIIGAEMFVAIVYVALINGSLGSYLFVKQVHQLGKSRK